MDKAARQKSNGKTLCEVFAEEESRAKAENSTCKTGIYGAIVKGMNERGMAMEAPKLGMRVCLPTVPEMGAGTVVEAEWSSIYSAHLVRVRFDKGQTEVFCWYEVVELDVVHNVKGARTV